MRIGSVEGGRVGVARFMVLCDKLVLVLVILC